MKKIVFVLMFAVSFLSFNNERMIQYIISSSGGSTSRADAIRIINTVNRVSVQYNFPPAYIYGIIEAESNFRNLKANSADARGVMQVTPRTSAKQVGCIGDLYNIEYNIECGVKYFDWMRKNASHFGIKNLSDLAAAYNCGPGCFKSGKWRSVKETTNYIKKVPDYANRVASVTGLPLLDMSQFPSGVGGISEKSISEASTKSSLMVDWDKIQKIIEEMINEGTKKMIPGLLILLGLLTSLEIMWVLYGYIVKNTIENVWTSLIRIAIRFSILAFLIPNVMMLIDMGYNLFLGIGSYFLENDGEKITLNNMWGIGGKEAGKIFQLIVDSEFNKWNLIFNPGLFFDELGKILLLLIIVIMIYYFIIRILFEMLIAVIQYKISLGLSWFFLPFDVNTITKKILGNKALTVLVIAGTKITVIIALTRIVFKNLEAAGLGEITFKELEYQTIFIYITVGMVMAIIMNKINEITELLSI